MFEPALFPLQPRPQVRSMHSKRMDRTILRHIGTVRKQSVEASKDDPDKARSVVGQRAQSRDVYLHSLHGCALAPDSYTESGAVTSD